MKRLQLFGVFLLGVSFGQVGENQTIAALYSLVLGLGCATAFVLLAVLTVKHLFDRRTDAFIDMRREETERDQKALRDWVSAREAFSRRSGIVLSHEHYDASESLTTIPQDLRLRPERLEACRRSMQEIDDGWMLESLETEIRKMDLADMHLDLWEQQAKLAEAEEALQTVIPLSGNDYEEMLILQPPKKLAA